MSKIGQHVFDKMALTEQHLAMDDTSEPLSKVVELQKPDADIVAAAFESQEQPNF